MKKMRIAVLMLLVCLMTCPLNAMAISGQPCTEPMTGARFTITDGWNLMESTPEDGETNFAMVSDDYNYMVVYTCADMYGPENMVPGISRSDIDNDFFSLEDVASEVFSTDPRNVTMSTFGNVEFYTANLDPAASGEGFHVYYALNYTDGYMHLLMYMGPDDALLFDFYTMANTIYLP